MCDGEWEIALVARCIENRAIAMVHSSLYQTAYGIILSSLVILYRCQIQIFLSNQSKNL